MLERQEGPVVTPPVFHQCQGRVPFHPGVICGLNFLLVLALLWGFFLGSPLFLPQQETTSPNCNLPMIEDWPESQQRLMWLPLFTLFSYLHLTNVFSRVESVEVEQPDGSVLVYPVCYMYMLHVHSITNNEIQFTQCTKKKISMSTPIISNSMVWNNVLLNLGAHNVLSVVDFSEPLYANAKLFTVALLCIICL